METKYFKKGEQRRVYNCDGGRILATIEIGGIWVSNPTIEQFCADGWEEYIPEPPQPYVPTAQELIHQEIRERYSENDEFQIIREKQAGKEGAEARFNAYNSYVEEVLEKYENE